MCFFTETISSATTIDCSDRICICTTIPLAFAEHTTKCDGVDSPLNSMEQNSTNDISKDDPSLLPLTRASSAVFTIDFGEGRGVDLERHKSLVEKYQKRHRRGLSASKVEENSKGASSSTTPTAPKKLGFTRKSSSSVEGNSYDVSSSEEQRSDRVASAGPTSPLTRKLSAKRERLSLPLKSAPGATERMVQSFTDYDLNSVSSTGIIRSGRSARQPLKTIVKQLSSPECEMRKLAVEDANGHKEETVAAGGRGGFVDGAEFDFDRKSDTVSETGTYTIDADVYTNEQKARMSIDREFRILDPVAGALKVAEYVNQLAELNGNGTSSGGPTSIELGSDCNAAARGTYCYDEVVNDLEKMEVGGEEEEMEAFEGYNSEEDHVGRVVVSGKLELTSNRHQHLNQPPQRHPSPQNNTRPKKPTTLLEQQIKPHLRNNNAKHHNDTSAHSNHTKQPNELPHNRYVVSEFPNTKLSPILSPTQQPNEIYIAADVHNPSKTFTKIMFPSPKSRSNVAYEVMTGSGGEHVLDQGSVISVTSSGAFRARNDLQRKSSLTKSDIYVEAYTDHQMELRIKQQNTPANTLSANLVHMTSTVTPSHTKVSNLPPSIGGKSSPSKIPSPLHSSGGSGLFSRPRSRNCNNESDSSNSLETECYLKPTQQLLNQLEKRLETQKVQMEQQQLWNNDATSYNLIKRPVHVRHNSLDSRNTHISNKLEHFQRKNLCIDQTGAGGDGTTNNGYGLTSSTHGAPTAVNQSIVRKMQNSPNNSPIRRSSSFSARHQQNQQQQTVVNRLGDAQSVVIGHQAHVQKDVNVRNSPMLGGVGGRNALQKSASTTNIKPLAAGGPAAQNTARRGSITSNELVSNSDHPKHMSPYHQHQKIDRSKYGDTESSSEDDAHLHQAFCAAAKRKDITSTRYNRAFSLRRGRLDDSNHSANQQQHQPVRCPNTPEMRRKFGGLGQHSERATSVDRKPSTGKHLHDIQSRYLQPATPNNITPTSTTPQHHSHQGSTRNTRHGSAPPPRRDASHLDHVKPSRLSSAGMVRNNSSSGGGNVGGQHFNRSDPGRFSMGRSGGGTVTSANKPMTNSQKTIRSANVSGNVGGGGGGNKDGSRSKQPGPRSNSSLSGKEVEFANWKRRKTYDPMKAAAEGKKRAELAKKQLGNSMTQSFTEATNQNSCDSSPSHSSSVHRSQSFHGTAASASGQHQRNMHHRLLLSSGDEAEEEEDLDDEDLTLSADEDGASFSPPTPSPSHQHYLSPWHKEVQRQGFRDEQDKQTLNGAGNDKSDALVKSP